MGSLNNLNDVHKFYCEDKKRIDKEARNVFVKGTMNDIRTDFQVIINFAIINIFKLKKTTF